jgi:hypothetical protein
MVGKSGDTLTRIPELHRQLRRYPLLAPGRILPHHAHNQPAKIVAADLKNALEGRRSRATSLVTVLENIRNTDTSKEEWHASATDFIKVEHIEEIANCRH